MAGRKYTSHKSGESVSRQATHFTKRYGEMDYTLHRTDVKPLARGKFEGYPFVILSLGTHPTAYVCLPKGHPYFGKELDATGEYDVDVHGGFTYARNYVATSTIKDRWWLGWDYAHLGDFIPHLPGYERDDEKKWTRDEIIDEVKAVIKQLKAKE